MSDYKPHKFTPSSARIAKKTRGSSLTVYRDLFLQDEYEILDEDGRRLMSVTIDSDNKVRIHSDHILSILPRAANSFYIEAFR